MVDVTHDSLRSRLDNLRAAHLARQRRRDGSDSAPAHHEDQQVHKMVLPGLLPRALDDDASGSAHCAMPRTIFPSLLPPLSGSLALSFNTHQDASAASVAHVPFHCAVSQPWCDERTPAGSMFTRQEWESAIAQAAEDNIVFEIRNECVSALFLLPRDASGNLMATLLLEGCLLLSPKARTTHANEVSGEITLEDLELARSYRVVRPELHRRDRPHLFGMRSTLRFEPVTSVL